ncbi:MAG: phosphoglycerate kinase [Candidatus Aenigmarchaeota archaeon]|nr:phosphoglycerate kinase [Candidatus Aenigmarchaeota archaeon]
MKDFLTLDDVEVKDKTVLVRVDINVPYDVSTRQIQDSERIREHAKTVKELADKGAKVVVLAHQGRKGDQDFIHLDQHAKLLEKHLGKEVQFVEDVIGERAVEKIKSLKPGEILLLDNVRFLDDETEEKTPEQHLESQIVQNLAQLADIFVLDAFSASHRSHASIVGFTEALPSYVGRVMERELSSEEKALDPLGVNVFVLGGAKPDDCLNIIEYMFINKPGSIEKVLTCGTVGEVFLAAKGYDLGKATLDFFEKKGFLKLIPQAKKLLERYETEIEFPVDVAFEMNGGRKEIPIAELPAGSMLLDIGRITAQKYASIIKNARTIVVKGPAGVYEKEGFEIGTKLLLQAIANSRGFSLIGGGDTLVAIEKVGIEPNYFSHVSLGGGALIAFLSGKPMPGVEALKDAAKKIEIWKK